MDLDLQEYERELEEARLELAVFKWNPDLHPRDLKGRFREVLDSLQAEAKDFGVDINAYTTADTDDDLGGIKVQMLKTQEDVRGEGRAGQVMKAVTALADEVGMPIVLTPGESERKAMSKKQLTDWYKRLGFKPNKGRNKDFRFMDTMIRNPQKDVSLAIIKWDPRKHPRDFLGRFREVLDQLEVGDSIELPRDVTVRRLTSGKTRVMRPSADGEDYDIPEDEVGKVAGIRKLERDVGQPLDTYNDRRGARGRVKMIERDIAEAGLEGFIDDLNRESLERTVSIRMPLDAFWSFTDDEEYLTQHDVGTSMGNYDPDRRDSQERYWWPGIVDETNRPVYGYLSGGPGDDDRVGFYGSVILRLEDRVKSRTTFTLGDSLDEDEINVRQIPMMIGGVDAFAVSEVFDRSAADPQEDLLMGEEATIADALTEDLDDVSYWEAQIFGGVRLEDVAEIIIEVPGKDFMEDGRWEQYYMLEVLDALNIPYKIKKVGPFK